MPRLLLDRITNQLLPYPRQDNEPVAGLDRDAAYVVEVVRDSEPEYDPSTHYLQPLEPVICITDPGSDDVNGSATYGWELVAIPEPAPAPDWAVFKSAALSHPALKAAILSAWPKEPQAAMALSATLLQAEQGATADFRGCWRAVVTAAPVAPETVAELVQLAEQCNLPADFVAALSPAPGAASDTADEVQV
jgi:hypothetical protein